MANKRTAAPDDGAPAAKRAAPSDEPIGIVRVSFADASAGRKAAEALRRNGVVVITDVFGADVAGGWKAGIINDFKTLFPWLTDDPATWTTPNLPPQTRTGLYQGLVCNLPEVWTIRTHDNVRRVFEGVYSELRGHPVSELFTSIDGINLRPPHATKCHTPDKTADWAHVDQTTHLDNPLLCVQGQVVLSTSSAGFVCSPGSHLIHQQILEEVKSPLDSSNWHKFETGEYDRLQEMVEERGGQWQIPVPAPVGSMILWLSSTVHSAKIQDKGDDSWRCVVYVCQRPKAECAKAHDKRLQQCIAENRVTNHWGTRLFPKSPRFPLGEKSPEALREMVADPLKVLQTFPVADTPALRRLTKR